MLQEFSYAAILPTPSLTTLVHEVQLGGGVTEVTDTVQVNIKNSNNVW